MNPHARITELQQTADVFLLYLPLFPTLTYVNVDIGLCVVSPVNTSVPILFKDIRIRCKIMKKNC